MVLIIILNIPHLRFSVFSFSLALAVMLVVGVGCFNWSHVDGR